jgi:outer membrane immunogenic protein
MKSKRFLPAVAAAAAIAMSGVNVACAADLEWPAPPPVKAPAYVMPPPFTWTGFYLGANLGGAWAQHTVTERLYGLGFETGSSSGAFIGGGQLGFNYQAGWFVGGLEGDFDWASGNGNSVPLVVPAIGPNNLIKVTSDNRWIATLAARLGIGADNWLFYGKLGGGWAGDNGFTITDVTTGASFTGSVGHPRAGWLIGGGVEWAVTNNWTVKVEYESLGLNSRRFVIPTGAPFMIGDTFTGSRTIQEVKVGFNYLFYWLPAFAAPY